MEELETKSSASDRHPAVTQGQEDLAGAKSVEIHRNIKKNSDDQYVVSQSTRTEMVFESAEKAREAYLNIYNAKEEAEFEDTEEHMDKVDKPRTDDPEIEPEIGSMTEQEEKSALDARRKAAVQAPLQKTAAVKYCVMTTRGTSLVNSDYFDDFAEAKAAFEAAQQSVDGTTADRVCLLQNDTEDINATKILNTFDYELGTVKSDWDTDLFVQAYVPGTTGVSDEPNPGPVSMGYSARNQKGLENYTKNNGNVSPEHQFGTNKPFAYDQTEQVTTAASGEPNALLQRDFKVSPMEHELKMGVNRELEHTDQPAAATEIALDHLAEDPDYYTKLNQVMPESGPEEKKERVLYVKPHDKEVEEFDYEKVGKEVMFPQAHPEKVGMPVSMASIMSSSLQKVAEEMDQTMEDLENYKQHLQDVDIDGTLGQNLMEYKSRELLDESVSKEPGIKEGIIKQIDTYIAKLDILLTASKEAYTKAVNAMKSNDITSARAAYAELHAYLSQLWDEETTVYDTIGNMNDPELTAKENEFSDKRTSATQEVDSLERNLLKLYPNIKGFEAEYSEIDPYSRNMKSLLGD